MANLEDEEGVKKFIAAAPAAVCFIDENSNIIYANTSELEMCGFAKHEYIGKPFFSFYTADAETESLKNKIKDNIELNNEDICIKCKDGSTKQLLISSKVHFNNEKYLYTMFISRDITKFKKSEKLSRFLKTASEELTNTHETEEALNKILQLIVPDFADWFTIELLSDEGTLELAKMTHSDPEKVEWALRYRELNPVNIQDTTEGTVGWVLKTGLISYYPVITDEMIKIAAKSEEEADVLINLSLKSAITIPLKSNDQVIGVVSFISTKPGVFYDETDLEFSKDFANRISLTLENSRLFENIRKDISNKIAANKQKDDFLAIASHELKTPLTSVKGYIHILSSLIKKGEELASLNILKKTERQINKMAKLIHNFLDVSRLESSKLVIEPEVFDLNELISETINYFNLPENKERLRFVSGQLPQVNADRSKISQVIDNYLSNALKYSPQNELVTVKSIHAENEIIVSVTDNGIGINEASKNKIFQRFYRAENMRNSVASGFGIGLYLSFEIIKLHSGRAWFESEEGKGSTFFFALPLLF